MDAGEEVMTRGALCGPSFVSRVRELSPRHGDDAEAVRRGDARRGSRKLRSQAISQKMPGHTQAKLAGITSNLSENV